YTRCDSVAQGCVQQLGRETATRGGTQRHSANSKLIVRRGMRRTPDRKAAGSIPAGRTRFFECRFDSGAGASRLLFVAIDSSLTATADAPFFTGRRRYLCAACANIAKSAD